MNFLSRTLFLLLPVVAAAQTASFTVDPDSLSFTAQLGGANPAAQTVNLLATGANLAFSTAATAAWVRVTPANGTMPASLQIAVDTTGLQAGLNTATVTVSAPQATPSSRQIAISVQVAPAASAKLLVSMPSQSFNFVQGAPAASLPLQISNGGSGDLDFTIKSASTSGWLAAAPLSGTVKAAGAANIAVTATPGALAAGVYSGTLTISSAAARDTRTVAVTMTINQGQKKILVSQTGLSFVALAGGSAPLSQTFGILNLGAQSLDWTIRASAPGGGPATWLSATPGSGTVARPYLDVSLITVSADPAGLLPGDYYGQIQVVSPGAANSPQTVTVLFTVRPAGSSLPPELRPTGLIFTGLGASTPAAQTVTLAIPGLVPLTYNSTKVTLDGGNWFTYSPASGTVQPGKPAELTVQADFRSLAPGVYNGVITVQLSDNRIATVKVLGVVAPAGSSRSESRSGEPGASCVPSQLRIQPTNLQSGFSVTVGQPVPLEVQVVDDCGNAVTNSSASAVAAAFSTGESALPMVHTALGKWGRTWQPRSGASRMTVTFTAFEAFANGLILANQIDVPAVVTTGGTVPLVADAGVVNSANYLPNAPVAPGSLISVFGSKLANTTQVAGSTPLGSSLGDTQVQLGAVALPLLYASDGQINAQVPYDVAVNTDLQLLVKRGSALSVPLAVTVSAAQPAIFTVDQSGSGQGVIVDGVTNRVNGVANPAKAGDTVVIYCTGLGTVTPAVGAGQAATGPASTDIPATVTIDGKAAQVNYSGLTPGFAGLYQVNAVVPAGVAAGNAVEVVVSSGGAASAPVRMVVR